MGKLILDCIVSPHFVLVSITKALVEAHNGRIEVVSNGVEQGSTFRFTIP